MKIIVGSTNPIKIEAVKETIIDYPFLRDAEVHSYNANSGVSNQPITQDETIKGAMNRAELSFRDCNYSVGLESGLMKVSYTITGYLEFSACSVFDGMEHHIGLSQAFEFPKQVTRLIIEERLDANEAAHKTGLTKDKKLGSSSGLLGLLTKGKITRKDYTKQAIQMALIQIENPELY
ncbi:inosine/xanthosine triphosphatase [Candidatus Pacearchaeota archaeon]|nr:inosine/xanthosine triphosphatase [Candidatus Pacearchaeota archaeon]